MGNTASSDSSNPFIGLSKAMQDMEQVKFAEQLKKNPDEFNKYVTERVDRITTETLDTKRSAFQKAQIDLGRYMDMEHNANYYSTRNEDVLTLQEDMVNKTRTAVSGVRHDKDITRRQTEINEWYYNDKLETVFFLQLFFIVMLIMAIVMYLLKGAFISTPFAAFISVLLMVGVGFVGLYRWRFTNNDRDPRFWHKRNFYKPPKPGPGKKDCPCEVADTSPGAFSVAIDKASQCGDKALARLQGIGEGIGNAASPYGAIALGAGAGVAGSVIGGAVLLGSQALSDTKRGIQGAGDTANRVSDQLEADTIAYMTGNGRPKPDTRSIAERLTTCPF
jgi:hypothetical protein